MRATCSRRRLQRREDNGSPIAFVDQGSTGEILATAVRHDGIELEVAKLSEAKRGFVLMPRRRVVERASA